MRPLSEVLENAGFFDLFPSSTLKNKMKAEIDTTFENHGYLDVIDDVRITEEPGVGLWETCLARTTVPFDFELVIKEGIESYYERLKQIMKMRSLELPPLGSQENFRNPDQNPITCTLLVGESVYPIVEGEPRDSDFYDIAPQIFEGTIHALNRFLAEKYPEYRFVLVDMYNGESMFLILTNEKMRACLESIRNEVSNAIFYLEDGESHL